MAKHLFSFDFKKILNDLISKFIAKLGLKLLLINGSVYFKEF